MKNVYVETVNAQHLQGALRDLLDQQAGPSMATLTGRAGRGKTESARRWAVHNRGVYVRPLNVMTPTMVLRELAYELAGARPQSSSKCLDVIGQEMERHRRAVLVDEADLLQRKVLEMLRGLNELCSCPVMLIGEDGLPGKLTDRRMHSRIRHRVAFGPLEQADLCMFFTQAVGQDVSGDAAAMLLAHCDGDWRPLLVAAARLEAASRASNKPICPAMVRTVLGNGNGRKS